MVNPQISPWQFTSLSTMGQGTATTGEKLSYTIPANKDGQLAAYAVVGVDAGVVVELRAIMGADTVALDTGAAGASIKNLNVSVALEAGDRIALAVVTAVVATDADMYLGLNRCE